MKIKCELKTHHTSIDNNDWLIVNIASWINTKSNIIWLFCLKIFVGFYGFLSERLFYPTRTPNYTVQ